MFSYSSGNSARGRQKVNQDAGIKSVPQEYRRRHSLPNPQEPLQLLLSETDISCTIL
jgi:hypothetical protein